jgi:tetrapyrrole methylase family protein/MazG family protein
VGLVRRLRGPGGCPWDREQTHASLRRFALEEAREVVEAIDASDMHALRDELGDLLLQVVLHAVIAEEAGAFGPADVLEALAGKLVRRHPHVFGDVGPVRTAAEVARRWDELKAAERRARDSAPGGSLLDDVPPSPSPLAEAQALGTAAGRVGFDWSRPEDAWPKVEEEAAEFAAAWRSGQLREAEEELGDLLFAIANVARLLGLDSDLALTRANRKFRRRFGGLEERAAAAGRELRQLTLAEMDALWERVKRDEPRRE